MIWRRLAFLAALVWMSGWAWSWLVPVSFPAINAGRKSDSFGVWWCVYGPAFGLAGVAVLVVVALALWLLYDWAFAPSEKPSSPGLEERIETLERDLGIGQ